MAQEVTLGGDRLGSGNKQKQELHNYFMNSFNLEQDFKSSMAPGVLYPFLKMVGTPHGTFDIDLDSFIRTLPTKGPLFGSFKFQADIFCVPIRLYQGILHNNPINIGMKMNQVYLPKIKYRYNEDVLNHVIRKVKGSNKYNWQVNDSSLYKYLGISGAGTLDETEGTENSGVVRYFNAVPFLAYYDIFKTYYSNKQEENAYVITPGTPVEANVIESAFHGAWDYDYPQAWRGENYDPYNLQEFDMSDLDPENEWQWYFGINVEIPEDYDGGIEDLLGELLMSGLNDIYLNNSKLNVNYVQNAYYPRKYQITIKIKEEYREDWATDEGSTFYFSSDINSNAYTADIKLQPFKLENIDEMRNRLLSSNTLGAQFKIDENTNLLPYSALTSVTEKGISWNAFEMNGLVVKTYQSDLFNNWLNSETIEMISQISAVDTSSGSFTQDQLNFQQKVYNYLNRVGVSGGTYEDWQEATYGEGVLRKAETPMYCGGMSAEVMFEEVVSSSETNVNADFQPLGSLGGKGTQVGKHGGNNIHVKCEEPCYIIGIASLTPRIAYSQGNDWDMTELDSVGDLHKPEFDGIGFQDLIVEQMAWWDTVINLDGEITRHSAGKQTAWINYQTAVDKTFADFAKLEGYSFMVLNRNYEMADDGTVKDITTYIDPAKYNYAFANAELAAQNFWVQIHSGVIARRKMAAQQIPNL